MTQKSSLDPLYFFGHVMCLEHRWNYLEQGCTILSQLEKAPIPTLNVTHDRR